MPASHHALRTVVGALLLFGQTEAFVRPPLCALAARGRFRACSLVGLRAEAGAEGRRNGNLGTLERSRRSAVGLLALLPMVAGLPGKAGARGVGGVHPHLPTTPKLGVVTAAGASGLPGARQVISTGFRSAGYGDRPQPISMGNGAENPWNESRDRAPCPIKGACAPPQASANPASARFFGAPQSPKRPL